MKKFINLAIVCIVCLTLTACTGLNTKYKIKVTSNSTFSGSYMTMKPDGSSEQKSVDGNKTAEYFTEGSMVSLTFQKKQAKGKLKVDIYDSDSGELIKTQETTAEYGLVSLASQ